MEKKRRKIEKKKGGKVENWKWKEEKLQNEERTSPPPPPPLFKTTEICFGSTKIGIFYPEKAFHAGKKIRKNDFAPSKKYSSCTPD